MQVCILNYNRIYITLPGHKRRLEHAGMYTEL